MSRSIHELKSQRLSAANRGDFRSYLELTAEIENAESGQSPGSGGGRGMSTPFNRDMGGNSPNQHRGKLGEDLGVCLQSMLVAQLDHRPPAEVAATDFGNERVSSLMSSGSHSGGGSWIAGEFSERFVEYLRPMSIVRQMGATSLPLNDGVLTLPKVTLGPSGQYVGETESVNAEDISTGDVKLIAKEFACFVPASEKLIRSPSANAAERIREQLLGAAAETEDLYFLRGSASSAGPTGMRYLAHADNIFTQNATVNLANVTTDLGKLELALLAANIKMRRPAWAMAPRTLIYLMNLRDGNGNIAFPELSQAQPRLRNKPVYTSTQIPTTLGSGDKSEIYLADGYHLLIGDAPRVRVEASNVAAYLDSAGNMKAAFSERRVITRLVMENDFNVEHDKAIAILTGVNWGV